MSKITCFSRRASTCISLLLLAATLTFSGLVASRPALADQLANRSIEMSDAGVSGGSITSGVGSGTNVSYSISFDLSTSSGYTSGKMLSYIVDFCSESPLIDETCTAPTGLDLSTAAATSGNTSGWTITTSASQLKATNATGIADGSTTTLVLNGITNPSTLGPFYARILTFASQNWPGYSAPNNVGSNYVDYGGVALTTTNIVNVSAKVQEEITFCVSGSVFTGNNCAGMSAPDLTIGHGSPTRILDGSQVDTAPAYMQTSTNAQSGAAVRMKNSNTCGGLSNTGGTSCAIPPAGATAITIVAGTANYGLNVAGSTGGIGTMSGSAPYATSGEYAMDNISTPDNVTTTFGSQIAACTGPVSDVDSTLTFAAAASNTTPAGIYTANMGLIATGTF